MPVDIAGSGSARIRTVFNRPVAKAGLKYMMPHMLRH